MASKVMYREWRFSESLNKIYPHGAQEWKVNWMNKTGGENKYMESLKRRVMVFDNNFYFSPLDIK